MRRRRFTALIGCLAVAWPGALRAQQGDLPVIGFLSGASPDSFAHLVDAFRDGLGHAGLQDDRHFTIEFRWAEGHYDRLPALAEDLVRRQVAVIVASGGDRPTLAAKAATATIPIVFVGSDDPVRFGLVESLSHPGGNLTGASLFTSEVEVKKLELLHEVAPAARRIGMLVNPNNPTAETDAAAIKAAAGARGLELSVLGARSAAEIDVALTEMRQAKPDGLLVGHDPFFNSQRQQIVALVSDLEIPAIYEHRAFVQAGGLMSYGNVIDENYRLAGDYVARILKGAKPADLPVRQATTFELVVNLKTAAAMGLELPASVMVRADDVVE